MKRPADRALLLVLGAALAFAISFADAWRLRQAHETALAASTALVRALRLSDPVLVTEARYTRHLSQADLHAAFQDHPLAFEHFPSGSLLPPPAHLLRHDEDLDRETASSD
ncbi:MAG: hypothetical protein RBR77_03330 [Thauera sp.]|jgi:hypothetical protein|nr:hypothetical protein [Thauera sp.]